MSSPTDGLKQVALAPTPEEAQMHALMRAPPSVLMSDGMTEDMIKHKTDIGRYWAHRDIATPIRGRPAWKSLLYVVEGEIGAGKTVLCKELAAELRSRGFKVCLILEPVDSWREIGILQKFYGNRARHGYGFQTFVFATRVLAIERAIDANPHADIYLLERSPATDQIFMELQRDVVDEVEMAMYKTWSQTYKDLLRINLSKARVLYLKPSLSQCMARTEARAREGELTVENDPNAEKKSVSGVTIEYQTALRRVHEHFLLGMHPGEFPLMPKSPFPEKSVIVLGPEVSDVNFRDPGAERDEAIGAVIRLMDLEENKPAETPLGRNREIARSIDHLPDGTVRMVDL